MSEIGEVSWNPHLEEYLASTGEKANCLGWCHKRGEEIYSYRRTWIDLPVIVGSGVIAFLSAGSQSMFAGQEMISSVALGIGSLIVGVLNTLGAYYGWAKRAEGHRIASLQYARLYRFLRIEMGLPREERMTPHDLLKYVRDSYDRLQEISPLLPPKVVSEFHKKFDKQKDISKPEEVNGLEAIFVYPLELRDETRKQNPLLSLPSETSLERMPVSPKATLMNRLVIRTTESDRTHPSQQTSEDMISPQGVSLTIAEPRPLLERKVPTLLQSSVPPILEG
jgi:hypothetical protein